MSNMSYCRFQNTLADLYDCVSNWPDGENLSNDELDAKNRLVKLCKKIASQESEDSDE